MTALMSAPAVAQAIAPPTPATPGQDFAGPLEGYRLVRGQLEPSYITAMGGFGSLPSLLFEANLAPHFTFGWKNVTLVATAKIVLRMLNDSTGSAPIRSPSYMPRVAVYLRGHADSSHADFWSLTLSHHSNGQAGPFYNAALQPNTLDGSFSTNFVELAFQHAYKLRHGGIGWLRVAFRQHLPVNEDSALRVASGDDQYGRQRIIVSGLGRSVLPLVDVQAPVNFAIQWEAFYIIDGVFEGYDFVSDKRLGASLTVDASFSSGALFGLFLNGYIGQDYYNIFYKNRITALRFGLSLQSITSFRTP
jgi:hypothetical protein